MHFFIVHFILELSDTVSLHELRLARAVGVCATHFEIQILINNY